MFRILIVYSSTSGNTKMVVDAVAEIIGETDHEVTVQRAEEHRLEEILGADLCILASPTYARGMLHHQLAAFAKEFSQLNLNGKPCALIALGDINWGQEHHIAAAEHLENLVDVAGAKLLLPTLKIDGRPEPHLKGAVAKWTKQFLKAINRVDKHVR